MINNRDPFFDDDESPFGEDPPMKRGPGRPKGSRGPQYGAKVTKQHLDDLYNRVKNHLTEGHRKYMDDVLKGKAEVDPIREMQLLVRYLALLCFTAAEWALEDRRVSQDLAKLLGEHRMALKDLDDMLRRERDESKRKSNDESLIDPIRDSTLSRFEEIHSGD